MLIHAQPEKVSEHWDFFAPLLQKSMPSSITQSNDGMATVLRAILLEQLQVWVYADEERFVYVVTTTTHTDPITSANRLLIYSLSAISDVSPDDWTNGYETLSKFAKSRGMLSVIAYATDEKLIKYAGKLGANTNTTLIEFLI